MTTPKKPPSTRVYGVICDRVKALMPHVSPVYQQYVVQRLNNNIRRLDRTIADIAINWSPEFPTGHDEYLYREVLVSDKIMHIRVTLAQARPVRKKKSSAPASL